MKRVEISSEKSPNFIGCWYIDDENISKGIIKFFENNQALQTKGSTAKGIEVDPAPNEPQDPEPLLI